VCIYLPDEFDSHQLSLLLLQSATRRYGMVPDTNVYRTPTTLKMLSLPDFQNGLEDNTDIMESSFVSIGWTQTTTTTTTRMEGKTDAKRYERTRRALELEWIGVTDERNVT
jgi:hypothetical protein